MIISALYYMLVAYVVVLIVWNLLRSKKWQEEVLYILVLAPFLLKAISSTVTCSVKSLSRCLVWFS